MKYYQDITLIPDAEANIGFLWYKVFQQVHIGLADIKQADGTSAIAVSFPDYSSGGDKQPRFPLGSKLRLFADTEERLGQFNNQNRLSRLMDYCHIKSVRSIPSTSKHVRFKRKMVKSEFRKAAGLARHLNKPIIEILKYRNEQGIQTQECKLPYIHMESQEQTETGEKNKFRLFIQREIFDSPIEGTFDCYGLSKTATVPWF